MRFYGKRHVRGIAAIAGFLVAGMVSPVYAQQIVIQNPYAGVNWGAWGQYKAALHVHSTNSDGENTRLEMLEDYYTKGFNIVTFHEHEFLTTAWDGPSATSRPDSVLLVSPTAARVAQMAAGQGRSNGRGMIGIANTNEHGASGDEDPFNRHHINTFNAAFNTRDLPSSGRTMSHILARTQQLGGISHINHPGRYTGGEEGGTAGANASNNPVYIKKYVDLFMAHESCAGMEIMNKFDAETRSDRILWDNILKQTMPSGRGVWGFSSDDSHSREASGFSYNIMLMPELSQAATLNAMKTGAFYAISHVDRREGINANVSEWSATSSHASWLNRAVPSVTNITVSGTTITVTGANFTTIDWIADGVKIATGNTINLSSYSSSVKSYVRAQLKNANTIAYLQPFGVRVASELAGVVQPAAVTDVTNGTAKTAAALGLPATVAITTTAGQTINVSVNWNVAASVYDPGLKTAQAFTVGGTFTLPAGVTNSGNIPLTVTISVTVKRELSKVVASQFGASYYRHGRTDPVFHPDAFNMSALSGWTLSPTAVGFGTASSRANLTLATTLVSGPGAAEAGTTSARHAWVYFKKAFSVPDNIVIDEVLGASGAHRIDDALIIYINGIEVYRYNVGGTGGGNPANGATNVTIGAPVNWASYTGYNTNATTMSFDIYSDYDSSETGLPSVSTDNPIILDAASLTNLKKALKPGANVITCLVGQNASGSSDLWFDLELSIDAAFVPFVPVTGITGVSTTAVVGTGLPLVGTVAPANATNKTVTWSVVSAGTTGAAISGNTLSATAAGSATVRATIINGTTPSTNYTQDFTITVSGTTSVLSPDKIIPGVDADVAVVAKPGVLTSGFSAGPNPAGRSSGTVTFYRSGGVIQKGTLTIFDAVGNAVNTIRVGDDINRKPATHRAPAPADIESSRIVGTWDLTDRKGRPVADGMYLVKGVIITSDGKRERVSVVVGVR